MAFARPTNILDWLRRLDSVRSERPPRKKLVPYYVAIGTTALALVLDLSLGTYASEATDALYILAAAASAYVGGGAFGILSVFLGLLPNIGFFNSPHYSLAIGAYGWEHIIVTTVIAVVLSLLVGRLRAQHLALQHLNHELENRVRKRTADLEESNRQLEAFCYTLAHDLRAPLRAIQGFSQITLAENADKLSDDGQKTLKRVGNSAEMMGRLIYDLLSYTQLHRSEIPLALTDLQEVVDRTLEILAPEIREKSAAIHVTTSLPTVTSNFVLLEQIVLSLLSNALKFSNRNVSPDIRIWSERDEKTVRLFVEDNGIGIAPQHIDRVFQPFQRLDSVNTEGTGIGLAMAKKGIERLNGKIALTSEQGKGTRVWLELPIEQFSR
jgi:signal transduction histidine kinase